MEDVEFISVDRFIVPFKSDDIIVSHNNLQLHHVVELTRL